ncbi:uncharacterized protein ATNIH1004_001705 [Aspergillus tanneri]|uniref:F-box domain-containing protein n=1 Tax=Aspergillus tanneri TaxID=1220188 RepID=A0A5M9N515_9EURO|nr:uncharacterized protein ATNIH1004_001705 [Aspergillus tanneri]KAA8652800.1 hypothetical protein ATNIH1004_001705 [Aspergillus tanneri]
MLLRLPPELLLDVISRFDRSDLAAFCRVSKFLHELTAPILFQSITIPAKENCLDLLEISGLLRASNSDKGNLLHCVRNVQIVSPFFQFMNTERCLHNDDIITYAHEEDENGISEPQGDTLPRDDDTNEAESMDNLQCANENDDIKTGRCYSRMENRCGIASYDLRGFTKLTALSWTGLRNYTDFQALRECFERTSSQLKIIELDFLTWQHVCDATGLLYGREPNYFAGDILRLSQGDEKLVFPTIKHLSLSGLSFTGAEREMAFAFNFKSLRSLKLRFCPGWEMFLRQIASTTQSIHLESLVIQSDFKYDDGDFDAAPITAFLSAVEGLQHLSICTNWQSGTVQIWRAMKQITSPLTSNTSLNIFHIRESGSVLSQNESYWIHRLDSKLANDQSEEGLPFSVGLTYDFDEFAQWAFGENGFSSLQILAYGDFSYRGRYSTTNILLCRDSTPPQHSSPRQRNYRHLAETDKSLWHMLHQYAYALQACPAGFLLEAAPPFDF